MATNFTYLDLNNLISLLQASGPVNQDCLSATVEYAARKHTTNDAFMSVYRALSGSVLFASDDTLNTLGYVLRNKFGWDDEDITPTLGALHHIITVKGKLFKTSELPLSQVQTELRGHRALKSDLNPKGVCGEDLNRLAGALAGAQYLFNRYGIKITVMLPTEDGRLAQTADVMKRLGVEPMSCETYVRRTA